MTTVKQIKDELDIHFKRIDILLSEIKSYLPFCNDDLEDIKDKNHRFFYISFH
jgi:hypothetical protein